jgi:hypothetical protein
MPPFPASKCVGWVGFRVYVGLPLKTSCEVIGAVASFGSVRRVDSENVPNSTVPIGADEAPMFLLKKDIYTRKIYPSCPLRP